MILPGFIFLMKAQQKKLNNKNVSKQLEISSCMNNLTVFNVLKYKMSYQTDKSLGWVELQQFSAINELGIRMQEHSRAIVSPMYQNTLHLINLSINFFDTMDKIYLLPFITSLL